MTPKIKIDKNSFEIDINTPGFNEEDIEVYVNNGNITVNAVDKKKVNSFDVCKVYKVSLTLPNNVDTKYLQKLFQNGVLKLNGTFDNDQTSK